MQDFPIQVDRHFTKSIGYGSAGVVCASVSVASFLCTLFCLKIAGEGRKITRSSYKVTDDVFKRKPQSEAQAGVQLGAGMVAGGFTALSAIGATLAYGTAGFFGLLGALSGYGSYKC